MGLGKNGVDWEGMSMTDHVRYIKIRRVLEEELDDNLVNMGDEELEYDFMDVVDSKSTAMGTVELEMLGLRLRECLSTLDEMSSMILDMRFGLSDKAHTLKEVGQKMGISQERVRHLETRALCRMRHPERRKILGEYTQLGKCL